MKLAKSAYFLSLSLALAFTAVGCRKGLDKTTQIPGSRQGSFTDVPAGQRGGINDGNPVTPAIGTGNEGVIPAVPFDPTKDPGIAATSGDKFIGWHENRDEFKSQTIYFDFDKSVVKASEVGKLEEVASRMKSNFQGKALRIEGHCDERGTEEYNRALGDRRALSIREKLVQLGLNPEMLPTISYGEDKPADMGHDDAAFQKNRRGELILLSPPGAN